MDIIPLLLLRNCKTVMINTIYCQDNVNEWDKKYLLLDVLQGSVLSKECAGMSISVKIKWHFGLTTEIEQYCKYSE
jgi:hypothetical protein